MLLALVAAAPGAAAKAQSEPQQQQPQQPPQQQPQQQQQVPIAAVSCTRTSLPPTPVTPSTDVINTIDGAYRLSNGQRLGLASLDERVVADFGRWHQIPLVAVAPDRFESRDGLVRLRFESDERSDRIVVSYPADRRGRYVDAC